jgi:hypothetical protein
MTSRILLFPDSDDSDTRMLRFWKLLNIICDICLDRIRWIFRICVGFASCLGWFGPVSYAVHSQYQEGYHVRTSTRGYGD